MHKNTKIVATLGPTSNDYSTLKRMVQAGMNVARLNFSHGTHENHAHLIKTVRKISKDMNIPIAIIQDLQGPKIRISKLEKPIFVKKGEILYLTTGPLTSKTNKENHLKRVPVQYKKLPKEVTKDTTIFINDGMIELQVLKTNKKDHIECKVICGGEIGSRKGMNIINAKLSAATLTAKDKKDLEFGIKNKVDYVALSFVKNENDILNLKKRLKGTRIQVISKIERMEAINPQTLEKIIKASDAVMVARGDLGVEVRPEYVPLLQKQIIHISNKYAKPVITATQMLQSMIENASPTRAEVSDVANAILDHTDAVMLSNETSVGKHVLKAVQIMKRIAKVVEEEMGKHEIFMAKKVKDMPIACANACAGVRLASDINADLIVVITKNGNTAKEAAKYRIQKNMIAITKNETVRNQLTLVWGINRIYTTKNLSKLNTKEIIRILKKEKLAHKGQEVVIIDARPKSQKVETVIL